MHSIVTTVRGADINVEAANFCAAMDTLIDQDETKQVLLSLCLKLVLCSYENVFKFGKLHRNGMLGWAD